MIKYFNPFSIKYWSIIILGIILNQLFHRRAKIFYLNVGNLVYNNFIIYHKKNKINPLSR